MDCANQTRMCAPYWQSITPISSTMPVLYANALLKMIRIPFANIVITSALLVAHLPRNGFTVFSVAKVLFGCSADEFFDFLKFHPFAASTAAKILEGEIFDMKLSKHRNGNAQHLRVTSLVPMMSDHRPAIEILKDVYKVRSEGAASQSSLGTSSLSIY